MELIKKLWSAEDGQGMAEYGLIIAVVAIAVIVGLTALAGGLNDKFNGVVTELTKDRTATP